MNKPCFVSLASLVALLIAGSALAQTIISPGSPRVDTTRSDRRCTSATLTTDPLLPCRDDVINDRPRVSPNVVRPPVNSPAGTGITGAKSAGTSMGAAGAGGISAGGAPRRAGQ